MHDVTHIEMEYYELKVTTLDQEIISHLQKLLSHFPFPLQTTDFLQKNRTKITYALGLQGAHVHDKVRIMAPWALPIVLCTNFGARSLILNLSMQSKIQMTSRCHGIP